MRPLLKLTGFLILAALLNGALAATIRHLEVERDGEAYRVRMEAVVEAPPDRVFALLTDFGNLERLNPAVVRSERLGTAGGSALVRTVTEKCVAFFCRRLEQVQRVRTSDRRLIQGKVVPEDSDFRSGRYRWELAAVIGGTRIRFRTRMVPAVWVPPMVGPWAIKSSLEENLRAVVNKLEARGDRGKKPK